MERYLTWYYLNLKLNIKSKTSYLQILFMIVIIIIMTSIKMPSSESVKILLYNEAGAMGDELIEKLINADTVYEFEEENNLQQMEERILAADVECGFFIHEGFEQEIISEKHRGLVTMLSSTMTTKGEVAREVFYAHFFQVYSEIVLRDSVETNFSKATNIEREKLFEHLLNKNNEYLDKDQLFEIHYETIEMKHSENNQIDLNKTFPIRGVIALILFLIILINNARTLMGKGDNYLKTLIGLEKQIYLILKNLSSVSMQSLVALILIMMYAKPQNIIYELLVLMFYLLLSSLWVMVFGGLFKKAITYSGWILTILLSNIIVCPVFFNLSEYVKAIGLLQYMFPLATYLQFFK